MVRMRVDDTLVKEMDTFIWEAKLIQKGKLMERSIEKFKTVLNSVKL
jgi:hypothetical protein